MDEFESKIKSTLNMASRLIQANLKRQAPVDTGALKKSIKVRGTYTGNSIQFKYDYLYYGKFVDKGTGLERYKKPGLTPPWNPKPGKGEGGIRPRFWTTLDKSIRSVVRKQINKIIKESILIEFRRITLPKKK